MKKKINLGDYVYFYHTSYDIKWRNWGRIINRIRKQRPIVGPPRYDTYYVIFGGFGLSAEIPSSQILRVDKRRFKKVKKGEMPC